MAGDGDRHMGDGTPKTVNELKILANEKGVNLAHLGFHLGFDAGGEGSTCLVRDKDGTYCVYEGQTNDERDVLYEGADEERAVAEIYARIVPVARKAGTPIGDTKRGRLIEESQGEGDSGNYDGEPQRKEALFAIKIPRIVVWGVPMLLVVVIIWWLLGILGI